MNSLPRRILSAIPSSSRAYSSFFSSNSGNGGRYFNNSKPPKPVVTNAQPTASPNSEPSDAANEANTAPKSGRAVNASAPTSKGVQESTTLTPSTPSGVGYFGPPPIEQHHPVVDTRDLKLLQFFTLHRPLLLLSNPTSVFQTPPSSTPLFFTPEQRAKLASQPPFTPETIESSHEADAEAARQLSRAMTMSHAGAAHAWEETLHRLGLDVNKEPARVGLQEQMEKEWEDVMMDSVKRKRAKKMKKHKLKKRRRATRAQRLKLR